MAELNRKSLEKRMLKNDIQTRPAKFMAEHTVTSDDTLSHIALKYYGSAVKELNQIDEQDFKDWVQERGLYFPGSWSEEFIPILSSSDPGEEPLDGGLLIAKYGKGHYVYSGYSWFRELPAGVPGAYRIFVNMISLGQNNP